MLKINGHVDRMSKMFYRTFLTTASAVLIIGAVVFYAAPTKAQQAGQAIDLNSVAFSINGKAYTYGDLASISQDFQQELEAVPANQRRVALIELAINMYLLAEEGKKEKFNESDVFKKRVEQLEARALRDLYITNKVAPIVTEKSAQDRYVELLARFESKPEIRARHILVETEEKANDLIKELDGGADFAELAKAKSTGPSGPNGGDLGYFGSDQMVAPFQEAASKLNKGEYSEAPVKTQFGWHVIKVEDKRESKAPPYAQVAPEIQRTLFDEAFRSTVEKLREKAKIEIPEPKLINAPNQAPAEQPETE